MTWNLDFFFLFSHLNLINLIMYQNSKGCSKQLKQCHLIENFIRQSLSLRFHPPVSGQFNFTDHTETSQSSPSDDMMSLFPKRHVLSVHIKRQVFQEMSTFHLSWRLFSKSSISSGSKHCFHVEWKKCNFTCVDEFRVLRHPRKLNL